MATQSTENLLAEIEELKNRLAEADQLIDAIKAGEVDAFAVNKDNKPEVFTLQSGDYAYRIMVENFSEGALNLFEDGLIVYTNTSFHEILKLSYENVIGKNISHFIHADSKESFNELFRKGIAGQSKGEINLIASGKTYPVHISLTSLYPTLPTVGMLITDLSERKQAQKELEAKKMLQNIFMQAPFALSVFEGKELVISLANELCCTIIGKTEREVIGKKLFDLFPETAAQGFDKIISDIFCTGKPFYGNELPVKFLKHGKEFHGYFDFVYQPVFDSEKNVTGVINVSIDVTDKVVAHKKITESEERFKSLADESPMFVFLIDADPQAAVIYSNKTWLSYTGLNAEEAAGTGWNGIMHPEDVPVALGFYVPALTAKQPYYIPAARVLRHDGEYRWHTFKGNPRYLPNGEFNGYVGVGFDIHDQKLAVEAVKKSEEQFSAMADNISQFAWMMDDKGWIYWYNQRWYDYTGTTLDEMQGWGWQKVHHPTMVDGVTMRFKSAIEAGTDWEDTFLLRGKDGNYQWFLSRATAIRDANGKILRWFGTNTNVEKEKTQAHELENAVKQRTHELKVTNESLARKNIELERINIELESFTYISSHDLQEPLRKIQTFATRLLEKENDNLSASGKDYFHRMQEAAKRMQTLIQDLLTFSRVNTSDRKFEITNLLHIIEEVKSDLSETIKEKNATIEVGQLCEVKIIHFQFRQLFQNLIGNALKFSKPDVPPHIKITCEKLKDGSEKNFAISNLSFATSYHHITITDNGIGFEQHFSEKIFQVFQRLHGKDQYKGTGIGLAIVKKIVENHNGIITVASELGKGAVFEIYIPA